jgi:hypothetical protein
MLHLPITKYEGSSGLWSQQEYVACVIRGIGFAAHRASDVKQWFHYHVDDRCYSLLIFGSTVDRVIEHKFAVDPVEWIKQCSAAVFGVTA